MASDDEVIRSPGDESTIRDIPLRMARAWNKGNGTAFAAPFAADADFVAFEGTHLRGRDAIASFHRRIFETAEVKGSRLDAEARFVRFLSAELAILHATARVTLPGDAGPSPSRDSMQLFVVGKREGRWRVEAVLNARRLTLERQLFLDAVDALPAEVRRKLSDLVQPSRR